MAQAIGVTEQAISRRKTGTGYPDMEIGRGMCARCAEILRDAGFPRKILVAADAPTTFAGIDTDHALAADCLHYHPYMRDKIVLPRLLTMTTLDPITLVSLD